MKIGFFNRLIIIITSTIMLALCALLLAIVWNVISYDIITEYANRLYYEDINFWPATATAALVLIFAILLFVLAFRRKRKEKAKQVEYIKVGTPEDGQIKIACSTLNSMICKNVNEISGVTDSRAKTNLIDDKAFIVVGVSVGEGVIIPKIGAEIQTTTKEKIQQVTGLDISEINVLVNNK